MSVYPKIRETMKEELESYFSFVYWTWKSIFSKTFIINQIENDFKSQFCIYPPKINRFWAKNGLFRSKRAKLRGVSAILRFAFLFETVYILVTGRYKNLIEIIIF